MAARLVVFSARRGLTVDREPALLHETWRVVCGRCGLRGLVLLRPSFRRRQGGEIELWAILAALLPVVGVYTVWRLLAPILAAVRAVSGG